MKIRPSKPPNYVFLDYPNFEGERPVVPLGALSEKEYQQWIDRTVAVFREHYEGQRAALEAGNE